MIIKRKMLDAVTALFIIFSFKAAIAALPPGLNYQGYLTDNTGVPIDGPVNMVLAIYDIDTGGTAMWSDSQSVTVVQGVFSVELGGSSNPFPPGLFENPLWLGLSVGADAEMTPRRPISSVGFSFKAGDADRLEGASASTLDQSAHVIDTANPHGITTGQIGAADATALSVHTGDTSNPHSVTPAQIGATRQTEFDIHKTNGSAHHARYTSSEAIAAMGLQHDTNSLNHTKYTDSNTVTAMLANDGAGSTLDSDKVDGLEASELIDAAHDEVRMPISALPYAISTSGSYYLTGNLDGSSGGININTSKVTLDLMGFTIDGGAVSDYGINISGQSNIVIKNGNIANFGFAGIYQDSITARYVTVMDVQLTDNGTSGTASAFSGIYLYGTNNHIERCSAVNNGGDGIYAGNDSKLVDNRAYNNGGEYGIHGGIGSLITGNSASNNGTTYGIYGSNSCIIKNNTASNNDGDGIYGSTGSSIINNATNYNTGHGINGRNGATIIGNTAYNNDGPAGIYGYYSTIIISNTAISNNQWGIFGLHYNFIKNNNVTHNNISDDTGKGGIGASSNNRIFGNNVASNYQNNIVISSGGNSIENNLITHSSNNGILFNASGNFYGNNRASENITDYKLNSTTQTTSTYLPNISF